MLLNIHSFLGPLPIGIPFHWLFASRNRFSLSMEVCWARHPPIIADHHDTPAVTGGLHPMLDTSPKNQYHWLITIATLKKTSWLFTKESGIYIHKLFSFFPLVKPLFSFGVFSWVVCFYKFAFYKLRIETHAYAHYTSLLCVALLWFLVFRDG